MMRVVFMGTPEAAVPTLRALAGAHEIAAVYTKPDRRKGRGLHTHPLEVKVAAGELGLEVVQPRTLKDPEEHARLRSLGPEVVVVVAFGRILPPEVLGIAPHGCVNLHFSLLPRWRGAAPVERAIEAGDAETGVTTMLLDEELDTGPILLQRTRLLGPDDTTGTVTRALAGDGAELMVATLAGLEDGTVAPRPQPSGGATYAQKVEPDDAELNLEDPAVVAERRIRAFDPSPGAYVWYRGKRLKVWRAEITDGEGEPGEVARVADQAPEVQTAQGRLRLTEVQPEGKRRMRGDEFVRGYRPEVGERLTRR